MRIGLCGILVLGLLASQAFGQEDMLPESAPPPTLPKLPEAKPAPTIGKVPDAGATDPTYAPMLGAPVEIPVPGMEQEGGPPPRLGIGLWMNAMSWFVSTDSFPPSSARLHSDSAAPSMTCTAREAGHTYWSAEYLLWWIKGTSIPPLVTTGSEDDFIPGALGEPGTVILLNNKIYNHERSGGRFTAGWWIDPAHTFALDASMVFLGSRRTTFKYSSDANGAPVLSRPYFDITTGAQDADVISLPDLQVGALAVTSTSRMFGVDTNARLHVFEGQCWSVDALGGFRYLSLNESLYFDQTFQVPPTGPANFGGLADEFTTKNRYIGGQFGLSSQWRWRRFAVTAQTKLGLGGNLETVVINGATVLNFADGSVVNFPAGVLALPTNIGEHTGSSFSVLSDTNLTWAWVLTDRCRFTIGYSLMYLSSVVRPGDQIDTTLNPSQLPVAQGAPGALVGPARPLPTFNHTDFWAQGISFGFQFFF